MTRFASSCALLCLILSISALSACSNDEKQQETPASVGIAVTLPVKGGMLALYGIEQYVPMDEKNYPVQLEAIKNKLAGDVRLLGALAATPPKKPGTGQPVADPTDYITVVQPTALEGVKISDKDFAEAKENLKEMSGVAGVEDMIAELKEQAGSSRGKPLSVEQTQWLGPISECDSYICIGMLANYSLTNPDQPAENQPLMALALIMYHVDGIVFSVNNYQSISSPDDLRAFFAKMAERAAMLNPALLR